MNEKANKNEIFREDETSGNGFSRTENPCVDGSIPPLATNSINRLQQVVRPAFLLRQIWDNSFLFSSPTAATAWEAAELQQPKAIALIGGLII
jgi:hypothetical protein